MDIGKVSPLGRTPQVPPSQGNKKERKVMGDIANKVKGIAHIRPAISSYQKRVSSDAKREAKKTSTVFSRMQPRLAKLKTKNPL